MNRPWVYSVFLLLGLVTIATFPKAFGQGGGADKVTYRDRADGKIVTETAEVKESPKGIEIIVGGKAKGGVAASDILKLEPTVLAGVNMPEVLAARSLEDNKDLTKAAAAFGDLVKKAGANAPERTKRYLLFREAIAVTKLADAKPAAEFDAEAKKALEKWGALTTISRKSWEIWPVAKTTARLQAELGDYAKATATLSSLVGTPDLSPELKADARVLEATMALRGRQSLAVSGIVDQLEKDKTTPTGAIRDRIAVLKAAAKISLPATAPGSPAPAETVKDLQAAIDAAKDPVAKGIGYMMLAELHLAHNQPGEAKWAYLWVDVVYNQEKDDQILAVRRLSQIFDLLGDKDRAEQFREKLTRVRQ
jgi:hypothetical protein